MFNRTSIESDNLPKIDTKVATLSNRPNMNLRLRDQILLSPDAR